ncbi:hypothetical protein [Streptomyces sp. NPDC046261]|uniref:hypothetical protein n=1 Tax=Streptomyces sp. NPDC046261 TaxID=3157200 RepID=UPI0033C1AA93
MDHKQLPILVHPPKGKPIPVAYPLERPDKDRMLAYTWNVNARPDLIVLSLVVLWLTGLFSHFAR